MRGYKDILDYGNLLIELSLLVPDGIICFFPSYRYMEEVILNWNEMGILEMVLQNKLLYIESKDTQKTSIVIKYIEISFSMIILLKNSLCITTEKPVIVAAGRYFWPLQEEKSLRG